MFSRKEQDYEWSLGEPQHQWDTLTKTSHPESHKVVNH